MTTENATQTASFRKLTARFTSPDSPSTLIVQARRGKKGINVSTRIQAEGAKTQQVAPQSFTEAQSSEATAAFNSRREQAIAKGWVEQTRSARASVSALTEIPAPAEVKTEAATPRKPKAASGDAKAGGAAKAGKPAPAKK